MSAEPERQSEEEPQTAETPFIPDEPGTSGLPDADPAKRTEGGEGSPGPYRPEQVDEEASSEASSAEGAAAEESDLEAAAEAVVEDVSELVRVEMERDEYLNALRHLQADFENYRKRVQKEQADAATRGAERLVAELLPVLDAADLARAHDDSPGVQQIAGALHDALAKQGLERMDPQGQAFDPNEHEAVMHEAGDGSGDQEVIEVLRAGYRWKGRVLRPAMVKVKG